MKNLMSFAVFFILISIYARGQQSQDTLYLKNGYKAAGKVVSHSAREYRFRSSEGMDFVFASEEVAKIVRTQEITMRKVNPDTLNFDQLNQYRQKAVKMRNAGRVLTLTGSCAIAAGFALGVILMSSSDQNHHYGDMHNLLPGFYVICVGTLVGIPCAAAGIPLWAIGGKRKTRADLNLRKFNTTPEHSMAVGAGLTIMF